MPESVSKTVKSRELKKRIIEILDKGHTQVEAAEATGTTRQYVSYIARAYRERGDAIFEDRRGRKKDRPLTEEQIRGLYDTITGKQPREVGIDTDSWSETYVQNWFRAEYKRTITRHQIRRFCMAHNIRLTPEYGGDIWLDYPEPAKKNPETEDEAKPADAPQAPPPKPLALDAGDDFETFVNDDGELDIAAMRENVVKTQAELAKKGGKPILDVPGLRYGKHRKQRNAPFTPKKKKKKKGK
ncbi:MAG: helix-turn-helix domain-containing protein [Opitutales bacterium]|nr:helix-turn-helix domain-containing protein [Opitutales bacterium]